MAFYFFLLVTPICGYYAAVGQRAPRLGPVVAWSTAGGALGAIAVIALHLAGDMLDLSPSGLLGLGAFILGYALFGFLLGLAGVLTQTQRKSQMFLIAVTILVLGKLVSAVAAVALPH